MPSDSISEGLIFQNFLGHAPRPPRFGMLGMPDRVFLTQLSCSLQCICAPPPFVNPGSVPVYNAHLLTHTYVAMLVEQISVLSLMLYHCSVTNIMLIIG